MTMHRERLRIGRASGFTLIELLVVMGMIAILASLALPAAQGAREAARRTRCAYRLKQLALATHGFAAARGGFPPASRGQLHHAPGVFYSNQDSIHCELLPYLEQSALYDSINFDAPDSTFADLAGANSTAASRAIEAFVCPSDPNVNGTPYGCCNFRANIGLGEFREVVVGNQLALDSIECGAFADRSQPVLSLSSFTDGLSNTLAYSEKPVGTPEGLPYSSGRDWIEIGASRALTADDWVAVCSGLSRTALPLARFDSGRTWLLHGAIYTQFYASVPPNSSVPDCGRRHSLGEGIFAARSYHPGGVNAAMADGSVRWFSSSTAVNVWRSHGTRNRGD